MERVKITQVRSAVSRKRDQRATLRTLGLRRIRDSVELDGTPEVLGMAAKVSHLVSVERAKGSK